MFSTSINVSLSRSDSNEIKRLLMLATGEGNTYISLTSLTINDMNENPVNPIIAANAYQVKEYTVDETRPMLENFTLDLDANQLVLTFDETVEANSLNSKGIIIHSTPSPVSDIFRRLTGGYVISDNSHIVTLQLSINDKNFIKLYTDIGTFLNNTYLTIEDNSVYDLSTSRNGLDGSTLMASFIVPDDTDPRLTGFAVNLNTGRLTLTFNEPVNTDTFNPVGITLQNSKRSRTGVRLLNATTHSSNGLVIVINFSDAELNEIKRIDALLISQETSYITVTSELIRDMSGNTVVPVRNGFAIQANGFVPDENKPSLLRYSIDMDSGFIRLYFNETVNISSFDCSELTLSSDSSCNNSYQLTDCTVDESNVRYGSDDIGTSGSGSTDYGSAPKWMTVYHYETELSFMITHQDLNELKALRIADEVFNTYLTFSNTTIYDQSDVSIMPISCPMGESVDISDYTPDTTRPSIRSFDLSINNFTLVLSFSETIDPGTLSVSEILLQNDPNITEATQSYKLRLDHSTRTYDTPTDTLTIRISPDNMNEIKKLIELAVSNSTTYLSLTELVVKDMKGNKLVPVNATSALPVRRFYPDITPPVLFNFSLDLNQGQVSLTFDETVLVESLRFNNLTFQVTQSLSSILLGSGAEVNVSNTTNGSLFSSSYDNCSILQYTLTNGYWTSLMNTPIFTFNLTTYDLNNLKRELCLATNVSDTFLRFVYGAIMDMNENSLNEITQEDASQAYLVIPDTTHPRLVSFELNLTSEILTLSFDETVLSSSLDPTELIFQSQPVLTITYNETMEYNGTNVTTHYTYDTIITNYTLTGGDLLNSDNPVLYLKLTKTDLDNLKALTDLVSNSSNSYLSFSELLVKDMNDNDVVGVDEYDPLLAMPFTEDNVPPTLVYFILDLDTNTLTLEFSETVNVDTLDVTGLTLISDSSSKPDQQWQLTNASNSTSPNRPLIVIQLSYEDMNALRFREDLATERNNTYILMTNVTIKDMNNNALVPIAYSNTFRAKEYKRDETSPYLTQFHLDMDASLLMLFFSETVNASSLQLGQLLIQNSSELTDTYLSVYNSSVVMVNSDTLYINLGLDFLNHLKRTDYLTTNPDDTYISFPESSLLDMSMNEVVAVDNSTAERVALFIYDTTDPELLDFDLDMNEGILTLSFSETVRVSTIDITEIRLLETGLVSSGFDTTIQYYTLSKGTKQTHNYHIVDIEISLEDLNEIKKLRQLATNSSNTHISLTPEALRDMFGNNVTAISEYEPQGVQLFTNDTTQPDIVFYNLDMDTGIITISFTETVDMETLIIPHTFVFYNSSHFDGLQYSLMDSETNSTDGPDLIIYLSPNDLDRLKFIRGLADNKLHTFLFLNESVHDMVGNVITSLYNDSMETRPVRNFTFDETNPVLMSFDFDLDSGQLFLTFSEVVDGIDATEVTIQSERSETNTSVLFQLTGFHSITGPSLLPDGPGHPPHVTITLSIEDLNTVKEYITLAVSPSSTFLSVTELTAVDAFGNPLNPISSNDSLRVVQWTNDTTSPVLAGFNFSADTGILELLFDETVDVASFNVTSIVFVNPNTSTQYQLQYNPPHSGATLSTENSTLIVLKLANDDLNEIKILTDLATSFSNTYLQLEPDTITDMSGNLLNTSNQPLQVSYYAQDVTHPTLTSFDLDMNIGLLTLYFNESVDIDTVNLTQIRLQSNVTSSTDYYSIQFISDDDGTFTNSTNGPIVHVYFGITDTNNLKRIFLLATSPSNTFISITLELISDMVGLPVVPVEADLGQRVDAYTPDTTLPQFTGFDFDLDSGIFVVTFDETVDASTFQANSGRIIFQNSATSPTSTYTLLLGGVVDNDDPILTYQIQDDDLHMIKKRRLLAISKETTYLRLLHRAVYDMALKPNPLPDTVKLVTRYEPDLTSPRLTNWIIDLNSSLLTLNFDEPVDHLTLTVTDITFQNSPIRGTDANDYYTLTGGHTSSSQGLQILVHITNDDLNQIKFRDNLLVSLSTSYLSFSSNLISDMNSRKVVPYGPDNATRAYDIYQDATRPHLLEYHLDMDASLLHLTFLETMNASSINFTAFVLQSASDVSSEQMYYRLTDGSLVSFIDNTVISINITLTDLNAIKSQMIAISTETSWLTIDHYAIQDMNDLYIRPLLNGISAMQASQYTIDTTQPELENFTLDLNTGILTLYFSETVRASSLNATTITIQDGVFSSGAATSLYRLSESGIVSVPDGPVVTVTMHRYDLNELKRQPGLATNTDNTYISVRSGTVYDMQMNYLVPIPNGAALQATSVFPDTTEPVLLEFSYDMDSGNLTLTFNEPVNSTAFISTGIRLEGSGGDAVTLTGGLIIDCYSTILTLVTDSYDLDYLKRAGSICSYDDGTCRLVLSENSAIDMSGNGNNATTINSATSITRDTSEPYLVYYDLDLTAETLTLTFSEYLASPGAATVRGIKLQASRYELIDIQSNRSDNVEPNDPNSYCDELRAYRLAGSDEFYGSDRLYGPIFDPGHPPVLVISLTRTDLNIIKSLTTVATSSDNTYLLINPGSAADAFGNELNGTREDSAIPVRVFNPDTINPLFERFTLDMNTGVIVLYFSESMNISSLDTTGISIQGSPDYSNSSIYTLIGGTSDSCNAPFITLYISKRDLDLIKKDTEIATSNVTTFISLTSGTMNDMNGNHLVGIPASNGSMVSTFTPDENRPSLVSFLMDMDDGVIILTFNETINSTSFQPQDLLLLPFSNASQQVLQLNSSGVLLTNDNTTVRYMLSIDNLNELKRIELCTIASGGEDCYLSFPETLISDMNTNPVLPITQLDPFKVTTYIDDQSSPRLASFFVNMSYGEVTFSFSETVNVTTFNFTALILHEASAESLPSHYYRLTGGQRVTADNGLSITFFFNKEDFEHLRVTDGFYDSVPTTYITLESSAVLDMSGNPLEPVEFYRVTEFARDIVGPEIIGAVFDMDQGSLQITFSETILASSFRVTDITLLNDLLNVTSSFELGFVDAGGSDGTIVSFNLLGDDVVKIKALEELATSINTSYLNHTGGLVIDKADNEAVIQEPFQVTVYIPDTTPPGMMSFLLLDLNARFLDFEFTEPIDISSVDPSYFTIQQHRLNVYHGGTTFNLSSNSIVRYNSPGTYYKQRIIIELTASDYKSIILDETIGLAGGEDGNTFISILSGGVSDFAGNLLVAIPPNNGEPATTVTDDNDIPELLSFDLDIDAGLLTLTFDNVMDANTLNPLGLTLVSSRSPSTSYTFTGGFTNSSHDYVIVVNITKPDLNAIKENTGLATAPNNTYLSIEAILIDSTGSDQENPDGDGRDVLAITIPNALQVLSFTNDTTSPYLESFHVDMNSGRGFIELTFDETVDAQTFLFTELILLNQAIYNFSDTNGSVYYLSTEGTGIHPATISSTDDSTIIRVTFGFDDSNNIKRLTDLFTNRSDTFISFGNQTVIDMNYNPVIDIPPESPRQVNYFIPDRTSPVLTNYTLDLNKGLLLLTFDEAIDTITFDPTGITLQAREAEPLPNERFALTSDSYNVTMDDYILIVQIGFFDLNEIKRLSSLAESQSTTYIALSANTIQDMNGNSVQVIPLISGRPATSYIVDITNPDLVSFHLDMNTATLQLNFTETVNVSTFRFSAIAFHSDINDTSRQSHSLTDAIKLTENLYYPTIRLILPDQYAIKLLTELATMLDNTYIEIEYSTVRDMSTEANPVNAVLLGPDNGTYTDDMTPPLAIRCAANLNLSHITLTFDEPVNSTSLNASAFVLLPGSFGTPLRLMGGSTPSDNGRQIELHILKDDLDEIKRREDLFVSIETSFVYFDTDAIRDMADNPIVGITTSSPLACLNFTDDTTRPYLMSFDFDANSGTLLLHFSETVNYASLNVTNIALQQDFEATGLNDTVKLSNGIVTPMDAVTIEVKLNDNDRNLLKTYKIGVNNYTLWLTIEDYSILDQSDEPLFGRHNNISAIPVTEYTSDITEPSLESFSLNLDGEYLLLTFSESVDASTLDVVGITLQNSMNNSLSDSFTYFTFSDSSYNWNYDIKEQKIFISKDDLNEIKRLYLLASHENNTFISIEYGTVRDVFGNSLQSVNNTNATQVTKLTRDITHPTLVNFNLNLTSEKLELIFDETVNASSLDVTGFTLQSDAEYVINETSSYTLSLSSHIEGGTPIGQDSTVIIVALSTSDLNEIKQRETLATDPNNTFLAINSFGISDMSGNNIVSITSSSAKRVLSFYEDNIEPVLVDFDLDMNTGQLTLTFSETVNGSSLVATELTLLGESSENTTARLELNGAENYTLDYSTIVQLYFLESDLNEIKRQRGLAADNVTTYLSVRDGAIDDMNRNNVTEIPLHSPKPVRLYTADKTSPRLLAFDLNLTSDILTLYFSETVDASSIKPTELTFHNRDVGSSQMWSLMYDGELLSNDSTVIEVKLDNNDLNEIKIREYLATSDFNTFLLATSNLIVDMNNNSLRFSDPLSVSDFTPDRVRPNLSSFDLDMDGEGYLHLTFSESVNITSLDVTQITLASASDGDLAEEKYVIGSLGPGSYSNNSSGPVFSVLLHFDDINSLKMLTQLVTSEATTYISITDSMINDMNGNPINSISLNNAKRVNVHTPDETPPTLESFSLDLNIGLLNLTFSETVFGNTLNRSSITLYNNSNGTGSYFTLEETDTEYLPVHYILPVVLSDEELNAIKQIPDLATSASDTWLAIEYQGIEDANRNNLIAIPPNESIPLNLYIEDTTSPQLEYFSIDLNEGTLTLMFDETVRSSSLNLTQITLQNDTVLSVSHHTLTNGTWSSEDSTIIIIYFSHYDLNKIKQIRELASSNSTDNTFISFSMYMIRDMSGEYVVPIESTQAQEATNYTEDSTRPELLSFDFDLNSEQLTLTFTETVDTLTLRTDGFTIFGDTLSTNHTLTDGYTPSNDWYIIVIQLSIDDVNDIKRNLDLAVSNSTTNVLLTEMAIADMNDNELNFTAPLEVTRYFPDTRPPILVSYDLDMDSDLLVLTFNETMRVRTINISGLTIQDSYNLSTRVGSNETTYYALQYSAVITSDDPIVSISLHPDDINYIKTFTNLASNENNTFLSLATYFMEDMNTKRVTVIDEMEGQEVSLYTPDTTSPVLVYYTLDLTTELLHMVFNETVNVSSIEGSALTLLYNTTIQYKLTGGIVAVNINHTNVTLELTTFDLNEIKKNELLATSIENTYISYPQSFVEDMNGNPVESVLPLTPLQAVHYEPDFVNPVLVSYHLDMNAGLIILTFTETVRASTLNPTSYTLFATGEANANASISNYTLLDGSTESDNGPIITLIIPKLDLDNIKRISDLSTQRNNTFLSVDSEGIYDMNNNSLVAIDVPLQQARNFTPDITKPRLMSYDLDMDAGTGLLWLTFSETMLVSTLDATQVTLLSSNESHTTTYTLNNDSVILEDSIDDTIVIVLLSLYDSNELKKLTDLATSPEDTYLLLTNDTIIDMNDNPVHSTPTPVPVYNYTDDTTRPRLNEFIIDMNSNVLTLKFSETVNVATLNVTEILLQDELASDPAVELSTDSYSNTPNGPVVMINISFYDINTLTSYTNLYNGHSDSYLNLTDSVVEDMNGNRLVTVTSRQTVQYIQDTTNPRLDYFDVDLDNGTIHLVFDETVSLETIDYTKFHLYSDEYGSINISLTNGSFNELYTYDVTLYMIRSDIDRTKVTEYLWTNINDTYLYIEDGAIYDWTMVNPVESAVLRATDDPIEEVSPLLLSFAVNMTSGIITLNFDEPVRPMTLVYQRFILQNTPITNNDTIDYRLTGGSSPSPNGRMIEVHLTHYDLNFLKSLTTLYISKNTTYLTLYRGAVRDMVLNPSSEIIGKQVDIYMDDTNDPYLVNYQLDMDTGLMILNFSESIDVSSVILSKFIIQVDSNVTYEHPINYHVLTNRSYVKTSDLTYNLDNKTIILTIHLTDLNELKRKEIANSYNRTWLVINEGALVDNNEQPIIPLVNGITAKRPLVYTNDSTDPVLEYFDLSMNAGTLVLSFSETVDARVFDVSQITLQNYPINTTQTYTLTNSSSLHKRKEIAVERCTGFSSGSGGIFNGSGSSILVEIGDTLSDPSSLTGSPSITSTQSSFNYHILTVYLSHNDLNNVKALTGLASNRYSTYISISSDTVADMVGNQVEEIPFSEPEPVTKYSYDDTRPEIVSFDLDIDSSNLTITFTETVNVSSLDVTQLRLQSEQDHFNQVLSSYTLTSYPPYPNTSASFSDDSPVIVIQIGHEDLNAIKNIRSLATSDSSTFLSYTSSAIRDNAGNPLVSCVSLFARPVTNFTDDQTRPELISYDLDLDDGRLILTFSESVKVIDSLDVTQITLVTQSGDTNYTLTDVPPFESSSYDSDGPVVTIRIGFTDLNEIKYLTSLATSRNTTYLSITNLTITDLKDFPVVPIGEEESQQVRIHTPDTTKPILVNYTLDMTSTTLTLVFNETVNSDSLNVSQITLQHDNTSSSGYHSSPYTLTPSINETYTSSDDDYIIVIHLGPIDRNEIKRRRNLAISLDTTWLVATPFAIFDMNNNPLTAIIDGNAQQAIKFINDSLPPVLVEFSIDMNVGQFVLTFDETVSAETLIVTELTFQDNETLITTNYTLTNESTSSQSDNTTITVILSIEDLNELKKLTLCREVEVCFIRHEFSTVFDMNDNPIESRDDGEALQVSQLREDTTRPILLSYNTNLTREIITMTFTETVNSTSLNFTALTLQDFFQRTYSYQLTDGRVHEEDGTVITFNFSWFDLNEIKRNTDIYTDRTNAWLTITEYAIHDMALIPNYVIPIPDTTVLAKGMVTKEFYPDVTHPELWDFVLNLTSHRLTLYFSETMLARSLDINQIVIQNEQNSSIQFVQLTMGELPWLSQSFSEDYHIIDIELGQIDTDRIKALTRLATDDSNTFISITSSLIKRHERQSCSTHHN